MNNPPYDPNNLYSQQTTPGQYPQFNQQPPYPQPGQFGPLPQAPQKLSLWRRFRNRRKRFQLGVGCATLFVVFFLCTGTLAAIGSTMPNPPVAAQPSPTQTQHQVAHAEKPTATSTPLPTPTPMPSPIPTPEPTQPPAPPVQESVQ